MFLCPSGLWVFKSLGSVLLQLVAFMSHLFFHESYICVLACLFCFSLQLCLMFRSVIDEGLMEILVKASHSESCVRTILQANQEIWCYLIEICIWG